MKKFIYILLIFCIINVVYGAAPVLEPIPSPQNLTEAVLYSYILNASDPEGGDLIFSDDSPNFDIEKINSTHARIEFTPTSLMVGSFIAVIIVRDGEYLIDAQPVNFSVNGLPSFSNLVTKNVTAGEQFYYDIDASDPEDGTNVNFVDNSPLFVINSTTGVINFTTNLGQVGSYTITITVNDSLDASISEDFVLVINDYPDVSSIPNSSAVEDQVFNINISEYTNNSVGSLTFYENASFFDINPSTGIISFTPNASDVGEYLINISVVDSYGLSDSKLDWFLNITSANDAPIFSSIGNQTASVGRWFSYDVNATDEEGDTIYYYDDSSLFIIGESDGLINFSVDDSMVGVHLINISVNDSYSAEYSDSFYLIISNNSAPRFGKNFSINIYPDVDSYVDEQFHSTNYLGGEYVRISDLTDATKRAYFNFSLDNLTTTSTVLFSSLNLTINSNISNKNVSIYIINESWVPSELTYSNQPEILENALANISSNVSEAIDVFVVSDAVKSWFNESLENNGLSVRITDEYGDEGNIVYYSSNSANSSKWPYLYIIYNKTLEDRTLSKQGNLTSLFDLDDYFYDLDEDGLSYNVSSTSYSNITIDSNNVVSIYAGTIAGSDLITFSASDSVESGVSNTINITVLEEVSSGGSSGSGSGGGSSSTRVASLSLSPDSNRESINEGDFFNLPVVIENIGELEVQDIGILVSVDKPGLVATLTSNNIPVLVVGESSSFSLVLDASNSPGDTYLVTLAASSNDPEVNTSAVFILDVLSEGTEIEQQLLMAQDLFQDNPECLELQELVDRAEGLLLDRKYDEARNSISLAIEGCKNMMRTSAPPLKSKGQLSLLGIVMLSLTFLTVFVIISYTLFTRLKYRRKS